jgi:hypothetical protein
VADSYPELANALLIAPSEDEDFFLGIRAHNPELSFACLTLEEAEGLFLYQSDERALRFLLRRGDSYELSRDEMRVLGRLKKDHYASPKLQALLPLRDELLRQGLLYPAVAPERTFLGKNILIDGYQDGARISALLGEVGPKMAISYWLRPSPGEAPKSLAAFSDIYEELHYVFNAICADLESGTAPEEIYLGGLDDSYQDLLPLFAANFGLEVALPSSLRLSDTHLFHRFLALYAEKETLEEALATLAPEATNGRDYEAIVSLAVHYAGVFSAKEQTARLFTDIAKTRLSALPKKRHALQVLSSFFAPPKAHVYLLNFAMGAFPRIAGEDGYLTDPERKELGLPTRDEKTAEYGRELEALFSSGAVKSLSFHERAFGNLSFKSSLVAQKGYDVIPEPTLPYEYSHAGGRYLLSSLKDELHDYLYADPRLATYEAVVPAFPYRSYDPAYRPFQPLDPSQPLTYSYSALKLYFSCPFEYYLSHVLKIPEIPDSFSLRVGNVFHAVLEHLYEPDFAFEQRWQEAYAQEEAGVQGPYTPKEQVLFLRLHDECAQVASFLLERSASAERPSYRTEQPFSLSIPEHPLVKFEGRIDKIMTFGESGQYFAIFDYKSGGERFDQALVDQGLSLQLPFYAYIALHESSFASKELVGLFISPILSHTLVKPFLKSSGSYEAGKYKVRGIYANDLSKLLALDNSARNSLYIGGLAYSGKTSAFYPRCAPYLKSAAQFAALGEEAKELALKADAAIRSGDFAIAPKRWPQKQFDACAYCPYRDICYRDEGAYVRLPKGAAVEDEDADEETEEDDDGVDD